MIKLTYIDKNGVSKNITPVTANYTRSDNIESLGMQLSFDLLNNPLDTNYNKNRVFRCYYGANSQPFYPAFL